MTATTELPDMDMDMDIDIGAGGGRGGAETDADLAWFLNASGAGDRTEDRRPLNDNRLAAIVATGLSGLPIASVPEGVDRALALVGHQRGVERAFYYRLDAGAGELELTHEWSSAGMVGMKTRADYARVPASVVTPQLLAMLGRGEVLRLPRTRGLLGGPIEDIVSPGGDRALAIVPVNVAGTLLGLAGFSAAIGSIWDERHFDLLRIVAQGIGRAIERKRIEEERAELSARADAARAEAETARSALIRILSRISDAFVALDLEGNIHLRQRSGHRDDGPQPREAARPGTSGRSSPRSREPDPPGLLAGGRRAGDRPSSRGARPTTAAGSTCASILRPRRLGLLRGRLRSQAPRGGADRRSRLPAPGAGRARRGVRGGRARSRRCGG